MGVQDTTSAKVPRAAAVSWQSGSDRGPFGLVFGAHKPQAGMGQNSATRGSQVLVDVSIYLGSILFWVPIFDPQPSDIKAEWLAISHAGMGGFLEVVAEGPMAIPGKPKTGRA